MIEPPYPSNEDARIATLRELQILDTAPEERFDRITRITRVVFNIPIVLVSLVDRHRQWFKSRQGLDAPETPRNISFCGHAILGTTALVVPDAALDPRFADNPLVTGGPKVRFYAGHPLFARNGAALGTLCIIDSHSRDFGEADQKILTDLAKLVERELNIVGLEQEQNVILAAKAELDALLGMLPDGVLMLNEKGEIESCNQASERIFGYVAGEVIGKNLKFLVPRAFFSEPGLDGADFLQEVTGKRKDGGEFPLDFSMSEASIANRQKFMAIVRDVSQKKAALSALKTSEERLDLALWGSGIAVWDSDIRTGEVYLSAAWAAMLEGVPGETLTTAKALLEIVHPDDLEAIVRAAHDTVEGRIPEYAIDHRIKTLRGEWKWIHSRGRAVEWDSGGKALRMSGINADITGRKSVEDALLASEARLHAVVDTAVDGIFVIDTRGTVLTLNPAAEKIFGYTRDEVIGQNVKILMPAPYREEHDGYLARYLETGVKKIIGTRREVTGLRKDGSRVPLELSVSEMRVNGERQFTGMLRDITERKEVERMKNEFVSVVSHELRTPLTSIVGSLGLVAGGVSGELPEQARALIGIAHNNSERLVRLINDILDIEKIESGKMQFNPEVVSLYPLLEQALLANQGYAAKFGVRLVLAPGAPEAMVLADPDRLMQVVTNLLSNAVKYSPRDGTVEVSLSGRGERLRVEVADHGPGIPEEFRSRIFGKFAQADSSDIRIKGGSGLGLSISKAIIERSGGEVGYVSEAGRGATFWFELPGRQETPALKATVEGAQRGRVLICEDDPDVAALLSVMLGREGYAADIACDAVQAKAALAGCDYDAMTVDLILPGQDGLSLIRELREKPGARQTPLIVISVQALEGKAELEGAAVEVVGWITKPIDEAQLKAALATATSRGSALGKTLGGLLAEVRHER